MVTSRHRKRTLSAYSISVIIHIFIGILIGTQFNWKFRRIVIEDESAIQVTLHAGILPLRSPARPTLTLSPPADEKPKEAPVAPTQARPKKAKPRNVVIKSQSSSTETTSAQRTQGAAIQTATKLSEDHQAVLVAPADLLIAEKHGLSGRSEDADASLETPDEDAPPVEEEMPGIEEQMRHTLRNVAGRIVSDNGTGNVDVVFLLDTSGSMYDNILAVAANLSYMASMLEQHSLNYRVGLVKFKYALSSLRIFPMTTDVSKFQRVLQNTTRVGGPERAYDALVESIDRVQFRPQVDRYFVLITDEPLSGSYTASDVWQRCQEAGIRVAVIGLDDPFHKKLAEVTGGTWEPIPVAPE